MKKWFMDHQDLVIEKIIPMIVIGAFVAILALNFDPTEWVISAEWLLGSTY